MTFKTFFALPFTGRIRFNRSAPKRFWHLTVQPLTKLDRLEIERLSDDNGVGLLTDTTHAIRPWAEDLGHTGDALAGVG